MHAWEAMQTSDTLCEYYIPDKLACLHVGGGRAGREAILPLLDINTAISQVDECAAPQAFPCAFFLG